MHFIFTLYMYLFFLKPCGNVVKPRNALIYLGNSYHKGVVKARKRVVEIPRFVVKTVEIG